MANESRLKIQREKKRIYHEKSRKQNKENPTSLSSFTCASSRKHTLKKVVKALPKSPNKRIEIVKSLASKFDLRIKLDHKKLGRPENASSDEKQTWLSKFLDRSDITYTKSGKNNQRYVGKENDKSVFVPIKYLLWNIRDLLNIANGYSLANEIVTDSFSKVFDKQLTFRQLYAFLRVEKNFYLTGTCHSPHVCAKFARIYYYYQKESPRPLKLLRQTMYDR